MKHNYLIIAIFLISFIGTVFSLSVSVVSEKHDIINHEIIFDVSTISDTKDTSKTWDLNIFGLSDKNIINPIYEILTPQTIQIPIQVPTTTVCDVKHISLDDTNASNLTFYCWDKDVSKGTNKAVKLYPCQTQILCTETTYSQDTKPQDVNTWLPFGVVDKKNKKDSKSLSLPTKLFAKDSHTFIKISWQIPLDNGVWGSSATWEMNPSSWWDATWSYKQKLTIKPSKMSLVGNITNDHVILVDINSTNTNFWNNVKSDGGDIRFINGDENTQLKWHYEDFNYSTQRLRAWVQFTDTIRSNKDVDFYVYYGNSSASTDAVSSTTYPSGYVANWHLKSSVESLGNYNGTASGTTIFTTGQIGSDMNFTGNTAYYTTNTSSGSFPRTYNQASSNCYWLYPNKDVGIFMFQDSSTNNFYWGYYFNGTQLQFQVGKSGVGSANGSSNSAISTNAWIFVCGTYTGTNTANGVKLYINGSLQTSQGTYTYGALTGADRNFDLGNYTPHNYGIYGQLDEVTVFNYALSNDEIKLLYSVESNNPQYVVSSAQQSQDLCAKTLNQDWVLTTSLDCNSKAINLGTGKLILNSGARLRLYDSNLTCKRFDLNASGVQLWLGSKSWIKVG